MGTTVAGTFVGAGLVGGAEKTGAAEGGGWDMAKVGGGEGRRGGEGRVVGAGAVGVTFLESGAVGTTGLGAKAGNVGVAGGGEAGVGSGMLPLAPRFCPGEKEKAGF